ncbi:helix-turn-helix transcriptional regulator [Arcicella sp. DC2W]|uniref:Helix-turn-helix transcriptional regulator n=1 Tax=Arcicella gelida TaxID=2984195 RepID=A0ABU5S3H1_9BACT|nr:helix-turn-helix transcriptional regulator [Arcicella sp. DC2W]MEA5403012.1 helix-turn-helix transcriptional regulator [Arcicella sp. DC2W]
MGTFEHQKNHLGRKIERIRSLRGMTQSQLGEKLGGISKQAVSKIEQSENLDDERLTEIANALGVVPDGLKKYNEESILYCTANFYEGSHSVNTNINTIINEPVDKIIELYERKFQMLKDEIIKALKEGK